MLIVQDGKLLLVQETKAEAAGKWGVPGGQLEAGETLEQCAIRECLEETGLSVTQAQLIAIAHKPMTSHGNSVVRFFYLTTAVTPTSQPEFDSQYFDRAAFEAASAADLIRGQDVIWLAAAVFSGQLPATLAVKTFE